MIHGVTPFLERVSTNITDAGKSGYAQSKWVSEQICNAASKAENLFDSSTITIARIGQLCSDTQCGIWNENEAWPLLIRTAKEVNCLPLDGPVS